MNRTATKNCFLYIIPPFAYAGLVFYLSSLPSWKIKAAAAFPDYLLHFIEYAVFAWLALRFAKFFSNHPLKGKHYLLVIIILSFFAVTDEFHQSFVPGRTASVWDFLADFAGIAASAGIYRSRYKYKNMRE